MLLSLAISFHIEWIFVLLETLKLNSEYWKTKFDIELTPDHYFLHSSLPAFTLIFSLLLILNKHESQISQKNIPPPPNAHLVVPYTIIAIEHQVLPITKRTDYIRLPPSLTHTHKHTNTTHTHSHTLMAPIGV